MNDDIQPDATPPPGNGITIKWIREKRYTWTVTVAADDNTAEALQAALEKASRLNQQLATDLGSRTQP